MSKAPRTPYVLAVAVMVVVVALGAVLVTNGSSTDTVSELDVAGQTETSAGTESALQALRSHMADTIEGLDTPVEFCFASDRGSIILLSGDDQHYDIDTMASFVIGQGGEVDLVIRQSAEVTSSFAAIVPGSTDGIFQVNLSIVEAEGANWLADPLPRSVILTDTSLKVGASTIPAAECAGFATEMNDLRAQAVEMRAWQAEQPQ